MPPPNWASAAGTQPTARAVDTAAGSDVEQVGVSTNVSAGWGWPRLGVDSGLASVDVLDGVLAAAGPVVVVVVVDVGAGAGGVVPGWVALVVGVAAGTMRLSPGQVERLVERVQGRLGGPVAVPAALLDGRPEVSGWVWGVDGQGRVMWDESVVEYWFFPRNRPAPSPQRRVSSDGEVPAAAGVHAGVFFAPPQRPDGDRERAELQEHWFAAQQADAYPGWRSVFVTVRDGRFLTRFGALTAEQFNRLLTVVGVDPAASLILMACGAEAAGAELEAVRATRVQRTDALVWQMPDGRVTAGGYRLTGAGGLLPDLDSVGHWSWPQDQAVSELQPAMAAIGAPAPAPLPAPAPRHQTRPVHWAPGSVTARRQARAEPGPKAQGQGLAASPTDQPTRPTVTAPRASDAAPTTPADVGLRAGPLGPPPTQPDRESPANARTSPTQVRWSPAPSARPGGGVAGRTKEALGGDTAGRANGALGADLAGGRTKEAPRDAPVERSATPGPSEIRWSPERGSMPSLQARLRGPRHRYLAAENADDRRRALLDALAKHSDRTDWMPLAQLALRATEEAPRSSAPMQ